MPVRARTLTLVFLFAFAACLLAALGRCGLSESAKDPRLDQKASKPAGFNVDQEVERCQGMGGSGEPLRLVARFWKRAGLHLLETRLSADQVAEDEGDDHFRLTATVNDTAQLRWWLLSFGSKVEVLEPQGLREEMANQAYWMNRLYARASQPLNSPNPTVPSDR